MDLAMSHGYRMNRFFSLVSKSGFYMDNDNPSCHPLETLVLGQEIAGPINVEIADSLGVHPAWVDGFVDGYSGSGYDESYLMLGCKDPVRRSYTEGFEDGHDVENWVADLDG